MSLAKEVENFDHCVLALVYLLQIQTFKALSCACNVHQRPILKPFRTKVDRGHSSHFFTTHPT